MFSSLAVTEIIDPRTSMRTGLQINTGLNITLNREELTRDCSYPGNLHRCTGRDGEQCKQGLLGPVWASSSLEGYWGFFTKIYFQADSAIDRETETLATCRLPCHPDQSQS